MQALLVGSRPKSQPFHPHLYDFACSCFTDTTTHPAPSVQRVCSLTAPPHTKTAQKNMSSSAFAVGSSQPLCGGSAQSALLSPACMTLTPACVPLTCTTLTLVAQPSLILKERMKGRKKEGTGLKSHDHHEPRHRSELFLWPGAGQRAVSIPVPKSQTEVVVRTGRTCDEVNKRG